VSAKRFNKPVDAPAFGFQYRKPFAGHSGRLGDVLLDHPRSESLGDAQVWAQNTHVGVDPASKKSQKECKLRTRLRALGTRGHRCRSMPVSRINAQLSRRLVLSP
jgi:hypothetical protein